MLDAEVLSLNAQVPVMELEEEESAGAVGGGGAIQAQTRVENPDTRARKRCTSASGSAP